MTHPASGFRPLLAALGLALALVPATPRAAQVEDPAALAVWSGTCKHYANRARFKAREGAAELVVYLADSCRAALDSLGSDRVRPETAARARDFLARLTAFKALVIEMNVERIYGRAPVARAQPLASVTARADATSALGRPVSATGEYLIARELGLLRAYRDWLGTGPDFAGPILPVR